MGCSIGTWNSDCVALCHPFLRRLLHVYQLNENHYKGTETCVFMCRLVSSGQIFYFKSLLHQTHIVQSHSEIQAEFKYSFPKFLLTRPSSVTAPAKVCAICCSWREVVFGHFLMWNCPIPNVIYMADFFPYMMPTLSTVGLSNYDYIIFFGILYCNHIY